MDTTEAPGAGSRATPGGNTAVGVPHAVAKAVGDYGERVAARHLRALGMQVLECNWRCDLGEIDIVARDGDCLVVCEVKTRRSTTFGSPVEGVTRRKAARLRRLAARWLAEHDQRAGAVRVDVVGVLVPRRGAAEVEHLEGIDG